MRRFVTVLSAATILFLAAHAAFASFVLGNYYFELSNWDNGGGGYGQGPSFNLPTGPTATTDGGIWIKTGSTYELNWKDVNIEVDFRDLATGGQDYVITNTMLLSTGVAAHDVNQGDGSSESTCWYPGYFSNEYNGSGATYDGGSPYILPYNGGNNQYYVPTALDAPSTQFQFDLHFWQGMETTYAAAAADGENVGTTGWFAAGPMAIGIEFPTNSTFANMPSVLLQPQASPEPCTMVLVASGLLGLLAYAWRRRK